MYSLNVFCWVFSLIYCDFLVFGIFYYLPQVFGHGWLCHPTLHMGQFSENFNLSTDFLVQEVKVQILITFYDSRYQ